MANDVDKLTDPPICSVDLEAEASHRLRINDKWVLICSSCIEATEAAYGRQQVEPLDTTDGAP